MRKLLFVCSGNTCRSPLALAAWRALQEKGDAPGDVEAQSKGLLAGEGEPASSHAVALAGDWQQDLSTHRAQILSPEDIESANWLIAMNDTHALTLCEYFEADDDKVFLLGAFDKAGGDAEILDPFGGSREAYETCAARIRRAVEELAEAIKRREI